MVMQVRHESRAPKQRELKSSRLCSSSWSRAYRAAISSSEILSLPS